MYTSTSRICLSRFFGQEQGNVAIAFGLAAIPAFIIIGAAIDFSRAQTIETRLQTVLDAATVAAANTYQAKKTANASSADAATAAQDALASFVDAGLTQAGLTRDTGSASTSSGSGSSNGASNANTNGAGNGNTAQSSTTQVAGGSVGKVTLSGNTFNTTTNSISPTLTTQVGTTILGLAGIKSIASTVSSSVTVGQTAAQAVEVSIMVDLTGSMGATATGDTNTKIANLRLAGQDLINILMPTSGATAKVAIAPFADYVNADTYAAAATGLSATGNYTNSTDLGKTKVGAYYGSYSGYYGTSASSQPAGSGANANSGGTSTVTSNYCTTSDPNYSNYGYATYSYACGTSSYPQTCTVNQGTIAATQNGSTSGSVYGNFYLASATYYGGSYYQPGIWRGYFVPTKSTACSSSAQTSGKLVTCVTERSDSTNYATDAAPTSGNGYAGAYNQGSSGAKSNYSSDGKCWVAGRELPKILPLTSDRTIPYNFFDGLGSSSVGGGTPGHIGTAWAWYMLSPNWNTVFTSNQAAAYGSARKVVVLMTDGEYNEQYTSKASATQAQDLCTKMKAAGVEVYTVGFGFSQNVVANASGTSEQRAADLLTKCSSGSNHYYFPYNGTALRTAFQAIGNAIVAGSGTKSTPNHITQ